MSWAFDEFVLDPDRRELRRGAALIKAEPQVFDLLAYLVSRRARVVAKDELIQVIWHGRVISESALTARISAVRRVVGDDGKRQRLIKTFSRKGVRFVGNVVEIPAPPRSRPNSDPPDERLSAVALPGSCQPMIAVFRFSAITGDQEERWFADSLVETFAVMLNRFGWLRVLGPMLDRASPDAEAANARGLADHLGVGYAVQGTARRWGERLRITARLVDASTGVHLWAEHFDGSTTEGFNLPDDIAATMASSMAGAVRAAEADRLSLAANPEETPYTLHLRAHPIYSSSRARVQRSLKLLERALVLDPSHGPALADAANCLQIFDVNGWTDDRAANRDRALALARRAVQVSSCPEVVATAAFVSAYFGADTDAAAALVDQALALNPSFAQGWYMNGMAWLYAGKSDQAVDCFGKAIRLNPRDQIARRSDAGLGFAGLFTRRFDEAIPTLRLIVQEFPHWATPYSVLASCYVHRGFLRDAEVVSHQLKVADPSAAPNGVQFRNPQHRELLAPGLVLAGQRIPN